MANGLISIGYQGRTADAFVQALTEQRVRTLVDVRLTPLSRKRGFSKRALSERLAEAGIDYVHLPALGNPKENRAAFHDGRVEQGRRRFREHLAAPDGDEALTELAKLASEQPVAVLCFEADVECCHRHVVVEEARRRAPNLRASYV